MNEKERLLKILKEDLERVGREKEATASEALAHYFEGKENGLKYAMQVIEIIL